MVVVQNPRQRQNQRHEERTSVARVPSLPTRKRRLGICRAQRTFFLILSKRTCFWVRLLWQLWQTNCCSMLQLWSLGYQQNRTLTYNLKLNPPYSEKVTTFFLFCNSHQHAGPESVGGTPTKLNQTKSGDTHSHSCLSSPTPGRRGARER